MMLSIPIRIEILESRRVVSKGRVTMAVPVFLRRQFWRVVEERSKTALNHFGGGGGGGGGES